MCVLVTSTHRKCIIEDIVAVLYNLQRASTIINLVLVECNTACVRADYRVADLCVRNAESRGGKYKIGLIG